MTNIGLIDPDRLAWIPLKFWKHHEFCFFLHDQMAAYLTEYEETGAHHWVINQFDRIAKENGHDPRKIDALALLRKDDLEPFYRHHLVSHIVLGLTADMLHFVFESLNCFEKRKLSVAYALLRKPLKENLLFLSWLLGSENDFLARFEKDNYMTLNGITPDRRAHIFSAAISRLATKDAFNSDLLEHLIFSKEHPRGFEPIWQRATHLITSQGSNLKTEDLNINFIFHDPNSDELYETLYANLPYILIYMVQTTLECFARTVPTRAQANTHLILSTMGAYESLFLPGNERGITKELQKQFKSFLKCMQCSAPLKLTKDNAASMYLNEVLMCKACGTVSQFPLRWLFAQTKWDIHPDNRLPSILDLPTQQP